MRVHHLNCGCMCPLGGALFDGYSRRLTASVVCHCLLIETDTNGLILVDTSALPFVLPKAGNCVPATPTSTTTKCIYPSADALPACVSTSA